MVTQLATAHGDGFQMHINGPYVLLIVNLVHVNEPSLYEELLQAHRDAGGGSATKGYSGGIGAGGSTQGPAAHRSPCSQACG